MHHSWALGMRSSWVLRHSGAGYTQIKKELDGEHVHGIKVLICRIFIFTNKINNNTSIGEASSGAFEETIMPVWWVICLVFWDCLDVIVVARIHC